MDCGFDEHNIETEDLKIDKDENLSANEFQKLILELFDKNGVLNDLRAYLRKHIVDILNNAQIGFQPLCQTNFTERLNLKNQAVNILIAEYLLQQQFNYSLSVFVSEIPLANMVFKFSKMLLQNKLEINNELMRFSDNDIWSILNHLGIQCDLEYVRNIISMYKEESQPALLLCILKYNNFWQQDTLPVKEEISPVSLQSSNESLDHSSTYTHRYSSGHSTKCGHYNFCQLCQSNLERVRRKYKENRKRNNENRSKYVNNIEGFMKNICVMEKSLVDEMFEQLKSVYESELEMVRDDQRSKLKRRLMEHSLRLKREREQLENEFRVRQSELESNIQHKKEFLWDLAKSLRLQHQNMSKAMAAVKEEEKRLNRKEHKLKQQVSEAQEILKKTGEDMRSQITKELLQLEIQLENIKSEKESIKKEKEYLETFKNNNVEFEEKIKTKSDILEKEFVLLKQFVESTSSEPKCLKENSTLTDIYDVTSNLSILNNGVDNVARNKNCQRDSLNNIESITEKRSNQVVNDFKKYKNVNYNLDVNAQINPEMSTSSEAGYMKNIIDKLQEENSQLRIFATQQSNHIEELSAQQTRLQAELTAARCTIDTISVMYRPSSYNIRPPSSIEPYYITQQRASSSGGRGARAGAGAGAGAGDRGSGRAPRERRPDERVPFVSAAEPSAPPRRHKCTTNRITHLMKCCPNADVASANCEELSPPIHIKEGTKHEHSIEREASPAHQNVLKDSTVNESRENAGNTTLENRERKDKSLIKMFEEAKTRLKKLEIETEAVEKSYFKFRKQHSEKRNNKTNMCMIDYSESQIGIKPEHFIISAGNREKKHINHKQDFDLRSQIKSNVMSDIDKYIKSFEIKYDIGKYFENKNCAYKLTKPIPRALSESHKTDRETVRETIIKCEKDLLGTPLTEFRKYYQSDRRNEISVAIGKNVKQSKTWNTIIRDEALSPIIIYEPNIEALNKKETANPEVPIKISTESLDKVEMKNDVDTFNSSDKKHKDEESEFINKEIDNIDSECHRELPKDEEHNINTNITLNTINETTILMEPKSPIQSHNNLLVVVDSSVDEIEIPDTDGNCHKMEMTIAVNTKSLKKEIVDIELSKPIIVDHKFDEVLPKLLNYIEKDDMNKEDNLEENHGNLFNITDNQSTMPKITKNEIEVTENIISKNNFENEILSEHKVVSLHEILGKVRDINEPDEFPIIHDIASIKGDSKENIPDTEYSTQSEVSDFSADVDNYNSRSDFDNTPISVAKSPDDNFWDT